MLHSVGQVYARCSLFFCPTVFFTQSLPNHELGNRTESSGADSLRDSYAVTETASSASLRPSRQELPVRRPSSFHAAANPCG
jgi:hypothetical protein